MVRGGGKRWVSMATVGYVLSTRLGALAIVGLCAAAAAPALADNDAPIIALAPHRAIYDLKLADTHKRSLEAVRGRIVYDFSGNACDGYELRFRQVTELDSGEGKAAVSDLRSTTWEDGAAKNFRFTSQNYLNDDIVDSVDGHAERQSDGVTVDLTKPEAKKTDLGDVVFPAEHMRRVIASARAGKTILEVPIFDGSETGEKVYNTLTVIGHKLAADAKKPDDPTASEKTLADMPRWPVTISYFDKSKTESGEQTPVYSIHFELLENGISRAVSLDYGDFSIAGEMTSLELKDVKPCK
jgi:hypothetical protein